LIRTLANKFSKDFQAGGAGCNLRDLLIQAYQCCSDVF
jgi:hypothetical protein